MKPLTLTGHAVPAAIGLKRHVVMSSAARRLFRCVSLFLLEESRSKTKNKTTCKFYRPTFFLNQTSFPPQRQHRRRPASASAVGHAAGQPLAQLGRLGVQQVSPKLFHLRARLGPGVAIVAALNQQINTYAGARRYDVRACAWRVSCCRGEGEVTKFFVSIRVMCALLSTCEKAFAYRILCIDADYILKSMSNFLSTFCLCECFSQRKRNQLSAFRARHASC